MERTCGEASTAPVPRCTVLLIGPTGAGKSATANALLGLPGAFVSRRHVAGVTQQPAIAASEDGLRAIDTPGLADPAITEEQCHEHIRTAVALAGDAGVDVVLVVLSLASRLTDSLTQALSGLVRVLGPLCLSTRTLVVWTHADLLQADGVSVPQWLEGAGEHVKRLLEGTLGGRWVAVDNHAAVADGAVALRAAVGEAAAAAAAANADLPYTTANLKVLTGKKARRQRQAAMRERLNVERLESMEAVGITSGFWGWLGRTLGIKMPDAGDGEGGKSQ